MAHLSKSRIVGLCVLLVAVIVLCGGIAWQATRPKPVQTMTVTGYLGGEKTGLFDDPQFRTLATDAGLDVSYRKAGSLDMMDADRSGIDYLFPSSRAAAEYGKAKGVDVSRQDIVFNSPIVVYTYRQVADGLCSTGLMSKDDSGVYRLDMAKVVEAMQQDRSWADVGWATGYGAFHIESTDPVKSNSGNEYAALLATVMNGGTPATVDSVNRDLPALQTIFRKSGWMETSSEDSFSQFLTLGVGSKPMMVGYESQILDLAATQPDTYAQVKNDLVIAYPTPTVWSTHVFIALDDKGGKLLDLMRSDSVRKLAWERHGFRSANYTGTDGISRFHVPGTIDQVQQVVELPPNDAMQTLINGLKNQ